MPRLFTGIEIPERWRESLAGLRQPLPGARWIEPENYHITLRFAGDIDNRIATEFAHFLGEIETPAFELRLSGTGTFGGSDPRQIWAGLDPSPELEALARANERAARQAGLAPEQRKFKGHVTIARLKNTSVDILARYLQRHAGFRSDAFLVGRFALFSAKPQVGGGPYVIEETFTLQGGDYVHYEDDHA